MEFHRSLRQVQRSGDFLVRKAAYDSIQDLLLAARQLNVTLDGAPGFEELLCFFGQIFHMTRVCFHQNHVVRWSLVAHHAMHGKQTSGLFDWESSIRVRLDMKMGHSGVPFVKKVLLTCDRRLGGGAHGMHLCTSADHSHLYLSVRKARNFPGLPWQCSCTSERG